MPVGPLKKVIGPGYVRVGPITAGPFGVGCLIPTLIIIMVLGLAFLAAV